MKQKENQGGTRRAVCYVRCSSDEQATTGVTLQAQKAKLEMYCLGNDLELIEVVSDDGISGKNLKRPGFQRIIDMAKAKEIDCVICTKLDRVSRSVKDVIYLVELF